MRKITNEAARAFESGHSFKSGNTQVKIDKLGAVLELHGNPIAMYQNGKLYVTDAGWPTTTTKERLNGLVGINIIQKAGVWYLNGKEWTGGWAGINSDGTWAY